MQQKTQVYNYTHFNPEVYDTTEGFGPKIGERALDFTAFTPDGIKLGLEDFAGRDLVIETGSLSCPYFLENLPAMNALANRHLNVAFVVLYVREDHPGEILQAHHHMEQKFDRAAALSTKLVSYREVLVDDIHGSAHRAYGGLPNMVYWIGKDQTIRHKQLWNHPARLDLMLSGLFLLDSSLDEDHIPDHLPKFSTTCSALLKAGPTAAFDYLKSLPKIWQRQKYNQLEEDEYKSFFTLIP